MRIECITSFLDGRERFEKGDIFTVDDTKAAYFVQQKWAKEVGAPTPTPTPDAVGPADLTIHNSKLGLGDNHG